MAPPISLSGDNSVRRSASQSSHPESVASGNTQRTNVFSDEYAVHTESGEVTPVDSIQDSVDLPLGSRDTPNDSHTSSRPISAIPAHMSGERSDSTAKRPMTSEPGHRNTASLALSDTDTQRSLSISSRVARPQSPYNGPTAPSQPYAMYPQVTRASSIASESTVRPPERPFATQGGPEHPYSLYQNTVPEDDDEDTHVVPAIGFSGAATSFHGSSSSGNDTGDIVGTDGHVEQLPPYTRYADNVVAKGDMAEINQTHPVEQPSPSTDSSTLSPNTSNSEAGLTTSESHRQQEEVARKEGLYERSKKRKCCGIPVVIIVLLIIVILVSGAVGGVVGGVVGNRKGVDHAKAASSATTTVWLDADPITTGASTPSCPTGHYTIPINNIGQVERCVSNQDLGSSWDCMDSAHLGITVLEQNPDLNGGSDLSIQFDDYSTFPRLFRYGPQPPDFNATKFNMIPVEDVDNRDYGVAMFFSHLFDKIVILPENSLKPTSKKQKRSPEKQRIQRRQSSSDFLATGQKPWYCYWNQTVEEFWIFLEKDIETTPASAAAIMTTPTSSFPSGYPKTGSSTSTHTTQGATPVVVPLEQPQDNDALSTSAPWAGPKSRRKRDKNSDPFSGSPNQPQFPKLIKMVEKRKPHDNIEPYCQQMQVLDNWQIVPIPGVDVVEIDEEEYEDFAEGTSKMKRAIPGSNGRSLAKRGEDEIIADLESLCICEWRAG